MVSVLFSIQGWPASELFACIGGISTLVLYFLFENAVKVKKRSRYARHVLFVSLVAGIILKAFAVTAGSYLILVAFMAFLVWFTWSVLEELPPTEN